MISVPRLTLLHVIFVLSGVAGLGYELIWTRAFTVALGHEYPAALAVMAAFFLGLALGAWVLDGAIGRSTRPQVWYAACELIIAIWAALTTFLIPFLNERASAWIGLQPSIAWHWWVAFLVPAAALLPATMAMGATLPAMERLCTAGRRDRRLVGGLYAANTLGAVVGVLLVTFALLPAIGNRLSLFAFAGINLVCAVATVWAVAGPQQAIDSNERIVPGDRAAAARDLPSGLLWATGLLGVAYEVLCIRLLGETLESTVYTFAVALAVYLLATAAGAALAQSAVPPKDPAAWRRRMLVALALACILEAPLLQRAGRIYDGMHARLGGGLAGGIGAELFVAAVALWVPALLMGALFSHLAQCFRSGGGGVGRALGLNTIGGAMAPMVAGVAVAPSAGVASSLVLVGVGYALLALRRGVLVVAIVIVAAIGVWPLTRAIDRYSDAGGRPPLALREGVQSTAMVLESRAGERVLKVNRVLQMGGTGPAAFAEVRQGHMPLLLHASPKSALFLGLGTAITFAAAGAHSGVEAEGVELSPEVVALLPWFRPDNEAAFSNPRLRVITADARRYVRATERTYDVIVADLFHPALDGAAALYTLEHFQAIRDRLAPGGIFCQWLPLYQMDRETLAIIARTFGRCFDRGVVLIGHYNVDTPMVALVGFQAGYDDSKLGAQWEQGPLLPALARCDLSRPLDLWGCYLGTLPALREWAGEGPINVDDRQVVAFRAPARAYSGENPGAENLAELLRGLPRRPTEVPGLKIQSATDPRGANLTAFWSARDSYLQAHFYWRANQHAKAADSLLSALAASPEFEAAFSALIVLARDRAASQRIEAIGWLERALLFRPGRADALALIDELKRQP